MLLQSCSSKPMKRGGLRSVWKVLVGRRPRASAEEISPHPPQRWNSELRMIKWPQDMPPSGPSTLGDAYQRIVPVAEVLFENNRGEWFVVILGFHDPGVAWCSILSSGPSSSSQSLELERIPALHHQRFRPYSRIAKDTYLRGKSVGSG